jgi:opacity protein-like surface antigen
VGAQVPLNSQLFWRVDYSHTDYDHYDVDYTTTRSDNFDNNESLFQMGLAMQFGGGLPAASRTVSMNEIGGFYAGTQLGYGALNAETTGLRAGSSPFQSDHGDDGASWGIFTGYGLALQRWYLGVELEAESGNSDWRFNRGTNRNYKVEKGLSYGVDARLGYAFRNGTLLYGRVGRVRTDFKTTYAQGANFVDQDDTEHGNRVGVGAEIPATDTLAWRFDYTHTDYGDYDVNYTSGTDNVDHSEDRFRLGLLFHF